MNYYALSMLINSFIAFICGSIVLAHNHRSEKNQLYALYSFSIAVWCFGYFKWQTATEYQPALFWVRFGLAAATLIPVFHWHHVIKVFNLETPKRSTGLIVSYGLTVLIFLSNFFGLFIVDVIPRLSFRYWPVPGPTFHLWILLFLTLFPWSVYLMWTRRASAILKERHAVRLVVIATIAGYVAGLMNVPLWYGIPIKPVFNPIISIYCVLNALAFFELGVWDIRLTFKKISLIILVYGSLLAITFPITIALCRFLLNHSQFSPVNVVVLTAIFLGGVLSLGPIIYAYVVRSSFWLRSRASTGLAHELKSPLSSIQSATDIILQQLSSQQSQPVQAIDYLQMIQRNADRLEKYVNDLLNVAKIQEDNVFVNKNSYDLNGSIDSLIQLYRPAAENKGTTISREGALSRTFFADQDKMEQVFSNILSNAIKFTENGSIVIRIDEKPERILFSINDNGKGVKKENIDRIFDRFYQGKNSGKGSGIGLTIAKGWVEAHGGKIWAESKGEGKGTTVTFTLPA